MITCERSQDRQLQLDLPLYPCAELRELVEAGVRCLSVQQPFAWALLHAGKDIENRSWRTNYRGPVLIHTGKTWYPGWKPADLQDTCDAIGCGVTVPQFMPRGGIVGVLEIIGCVREHDSPWFWGPFGFVVGNARALPFWPCNGKRGFFGLELPQAA